MSASDPVLALPPILLFLTSMFASRLAKSSLAPLQSALSRLVLAVPPPSSSQAGGAAQKLTRSFTSSPASMAGIIRDVSATTFAAEVKEAEPDSFVVVDVREPWELELARLRTIPHVNLPMSKLGSAEGAEAVEALDKSKPIYVMVSREMLDTHKH